MIERDEKLKATVAYLKNDFTPTTPEEAELVKVIYDSGRVEFAVPVRKSK